MSWIFAFFRAKSVDSDVQNQNRKTPLFPTYRLKNAIEFPILKKTTSSCWLGGSKTPNFKQHKGIDMYKKIFTGSRKIVWLLPICCLTIACGPSYRTTHTYTTPSSSEGRMCVLQCQNIKSKCEQIQDMSKEHCEYREDREYDRCEERQEKKKKNKRSICFRGSCSANYVKCEKHYKSCYQACGGTVKSVTTCVRNCDKIWLFLSLLPDCSLCRYWPRTRHRRIPSPFINTWMHRAYCTWPANRPPELRQKQFYSKNYKVSPACVLHLTNKPSGHYWGSFCKRFWQSEDRPVINKILASVGEATGSPGWDDYDQDMPVEENGLSIPEYEFDQCVSGWE